MTQDILPNTQFAKEDLETLEDHVQQYVDGNAAETRLSLRSPRALPHYASLVRSQLVPPTSSRTLNSSGGNGNGSDGAGRGDEHDDDDDIERDRGNDEHPRKRPFHDRLSSPDADHDDGPSHTTVSPCTEATVTVKGLRCPNRLGSRSRCPALLDTASDQLTDPSDDLLPRHPSRKLLRLLDDALSKSEDNPQAENVLGRMAKTIVRAPICAQHAFERDLIPKVVYNGWKQEIARESSIFWLNALKMSAKSQGLGGDIANFHLIRRG
ncbi:hypothetical protein B0H13DRAFT_1850102 [Mycena leptocephala]|nr:hypothetical protein B0H13DRAFT_1850102 [Mycena leptocephala]